MGKKEGDGQLFFFGLTSWPMRLEIAIGSLPGLHRLEKAGRPRSGQKEAETSQEAEFRSGWGNCKLEGPKAKSMVLLKSEDEMKDKRFSISGAPSLKYGFWKFITTRCGSMCPHPPTHTLLHILNDFCTFIQTQP